MKLPVRRRKAMPTTPGQAGVARLDRRTKDLAKRIEPGEIAVINHVDIDRVAAESLVAAGAIAVVNAARSISGRYPNMGPEILVERGVTVVDNVGEDIFETLSDGDLITIDDGTIYLDGDEVAHGEVLDPDRLDELMVEARAGLSAQIEAFTANTMEYLNVERDLLLDGVGIPPVDTTFEGRHALVVVRGYDYHKDLRHLRHYIREYRPVLIGVDGGADALLADGYQPDVIVGDMDSVSDKALRCGAELIVHAYRDGNAPGLARLTELGVDAKTLPATGTSEDIAMLLADHLGAKLIVAVGTHATLVEFLDKGRAGMASTFLTRLRLGGKLVDAKGVNRLYDNRIRTWQFALLLLAGVAALAVALSVTEVGQEWIDVLRARWSDLVYWAQGLF